VSRLAFYALLNIFSVVIWAANLATRAKFLGFGPVWIDWIAERPPPERPDPCEYEEDEPSMGGMPVSRALDVLARAALTPAPRPEAGER
jgi:hypothetical protein